METGIGDRGSYGDGIDGGDKGAGKESGAGHGKLQGGVGFGWWWCFRGGHS